VLSALALVLFVLVPLVLAMTVWAAIEHVHGRRVVSAARPRAAL
jgi:hypothetical protein